MAEKDRRQIPLLPVLFCVIETPDEIAMACHTYSGVEE